MKIKLNEQQLKRVNKSMLMCITMLDVLLFFLNLRIIISNNLEGYRTNSFIWSYMMMFMVTICAVLNIMLYIKDNCNNQLKYIMCIGWLICDAVGIFAFGAYETYSVSFIVMCASILCIDEKLVKLVNYISCLTLAACAVTDIASGRHSIDEYVICIVMTISIGITNILIVKLVTKFIDESQYTILEANEKQKKITEKVSDTAKKVSKDFKVILKDLSGINNQAKDNIVSMENIAESMDNTANEIQNQVTLTNNIQDIIGKTEKSAEKVTETVKTALNTVSNGVKLAGDLKEQSKIVDNNTTKMSKTVNN